MKELEFCVDFCAVSRKDMNERWMNTSMNEAAKLTIVKRERSSKGDMNKLRQEGFLPGSISIKG